MPGPRKPRLTFFEEQLLFELRAIRLAILEHSKNTGKWLSAVAVAAANPEDNTEEVQKLLDEKAAEIDASGKSMEEALAQFNQPKES